MPRYVYRCTECEELSTLSHSPDETIVACEKCGASHGLVKILTSFSTKKKTQVNHVIGEQTEEFIKSSREDLSMQRKELLDKSKT